MSTAAGAGELRRLLVLARPRAAGLALAGVAGFLCVGCSVGLLATSAYLIARAAQHPPILSLAVAIVAVRFFGIARGVLRYLERLLTHDAGFRLLADLRVAVYSALERLSPGGLERHRSGDLLGRVVGDVDALQQVYVRVLTPPVVAALVIVLASGIAGLVLPATGALLAALLVLAATAVPWLSHHLGRREGERIAGLRGELSGAVVELLQGAPDLAAFGAAEHRLAEVAALDAEFTRRRRRAAWVAGLAGGAVTTVAGIAVWAMLVVGLPAVRAGGLDGVLLGVLALTAMAAFEAVTPLTPALQALTEARGAARRIFALLDATPPIVDPAHPLPVPQVGTAALEDVRLRYGETAPWALDGVSLRLEPGRRVALVGPSGAGKTSVASVLLRFREPDGGRATLGGVDLRHLDQDEVRRVIGMAGEDAHVFATTVRHNLLLARPAATEEELRTAARRASLLEWIESLPRGWDTQVGELGAQLSGGQRRRLALARALLADFSVLIVDEPTAHLDPATAGAVMRELLAATRGRTLLLITHRLEGVEQLDHIAVMEAGRIVEEGTHAELMHRAGAYRAMRCGSRPTT